MRKFYQFIVKHPFPVILFLLVLTGLFASRLPGLTKDDSVDKMLPDGDPLLEYTREIEEIFSSDEFLVVAVESPDAFSFETVSKLVILTDRLESIDGVIEVVSPTNTKNVRGSSGEMFSEPLVDESNIPSTPEDLESYRKAITGKDIFRNSIISDDGSTFGFFLRLEKDPDKKAIVGAVKAIVDEFQGPEKIYFSGSPAINLMVGKYMAADMGRFFPLVIIVILGVFGLSFRSAGGILLPLAVLLMTVIWTLGLMSVTGIPISVIGTMLPALLIAIGSSYGIHIMHQYYEDISGQSDRRAAVTEAMSNIGPTILLAGLTTAMGFATLMLNDTRILREFGFFASFGILSSMIISLTFLPASLTFFRPPGENRRRALTGGVLTRVLESAGRFSLRRRYAALIAGGILIALALAGYHRLYIETNAVNFFREDDPVRDTIAKISTKFGGTIPIRTVIESGGRENILEPSTLRQIEAYQRYLESFDRVGKTLSIADMIKDMNMALHEGDPSFYRVPDTLLAAEQYLFLYSLASEPDEFRSLIDDSHSMAAVTARLRQVDEFNAPLGTRDTDIILNKLENFIGGNFSPELKVTPTGRARNIVRTSDYIVRGLIRSMVTAILCIFALSALIFRSFGAGLFSILTVSVALVLNFGVMGWLGIPLDIATTLISSIAIGIGVDDSIHYILRYRRAVRKMGMTPEDAMVHSLSHAGRPIYYTSLALVLGFAVLTVASFKPVIYFGGLTALTMVNTTVGAILILPAVLNLARPAFIIKKS